jgi:hypothetical protein
MRTYISSWSSTSPGGLDDRSMASHHLCVPLVDVLTTIKVPGTLTENADRKIRSVIRLVRKGVSVYR